MLCRQGPVRHTPVQYEVRTAWYNYTRRDSKTYAGILQSRNGTKSGRYIILAYDVTPGVRCSAVVRVIELSNPVQKHITFYYLNEYIKRKRMNRGLKECLKY